MDPTVNAGLVIFAAVLPLLIALVKQAHFSTQVNALIAFACYIIVGVAGAFIQYGTLPSPETLVEFIATVTVIGSTAYKLFWSNLGVTNENTQSVEERLVNATSWGTNAS
jgi:hypothetical protein